MTDWERIVSAQSGLVWRTAWRLLGSEADAADCCQETFLAALELSRRQAVRNWSGLLVRLATCKALNQMRRRRSRGGGADELAEVASPRPGPPQDAAAAELAAALREALVQLPADQAEAFSLRHFGGMSYGEIARAMGLKGSAAGVLLHRARERLRELLAAYEQKSVEDDAEVSA